MAQTTEVFKESFCSDHLFSEATNYLRHREATMKMRLLPTLVGLAINFAVPAFAQEKDTVNPQTTQKILAVGKAWDEAENNNDAAPIAALFTEDGVFVQIEDQSMVGRSLRNGTQNCSRDGTSKTTSSISRSTASFNPFSVKPLPECPK
jgi:hypothetical protein